MKPKHFKNLLKRHRQGRLSDAEQKQVDTWYDSFGYGENIKPLEDERAAQHKQDQLWANLQRHIHQPGNVRSMPVWRYAAAVLMFLAAGLLVFQRFASSTKADTMDTVRTFAGQLKKITLPDSSEVWVNAASVLRYKSNDFAEHRNVYLDRGEAFFTVTKDKKHPFTVHTSDLYTRVLGTQFNVKAYRELRYTSVNVKEGRVSVTPSGNVAHAQIITAGEGLIYHPESGVLEREDNRLVETESWVNGNIILREVSFSELALVFYNRYKLKLTTQNAAVRQNHYTVNITQNQSPSGCSNCFALSMATTTGGPRMK